MRASSSSREIVLALFASVAFSAPLVATAATNSPPDEKPITPAAAEANQLVQQALTAEAKGEAGERETLLKQAIQSSPDLAAAHWHSGEVQVGGKWVSVDDAAALTSKSGKLDEYRQKRDVLLQKLAKQQVADVRPSPEDQLELARWCEKAGLKEQQRFHLLAALQLAPSLAEPRKKLGLVRYRGMLMPIDQVDDFDARLKKLQDDFAVWKNRLQGLRKQIDSGREKDQALDQIRAVRDVAAIPALETLFGNSKPEIARAVVVALSGMPERQATESLVRFAVASDDASIREQAAYALRPRSVFSYAPILLNAMRTPNIVRYSSYMLPNGRMGYQMSIFREGEGENTMQTSVASYGDKVPMMRPDVAVRNRLGPPIGDAPASRARYGAVEGRAEQTAARAVRENDAIEVTNGRIASVLRATTGEDIGDDAMAWWSWWFDYNEMYEISDPPTDYVSEYVSESPTIGSSHSCFVAGTPVWTMGGLMQIQHIQPGDCVLAQSPETGELAYKAVLSTTSGPNLPLTNIQVGDALIRCTRGHLFWVSGKGWTMAKDLKAGEQLHTARGSVAIDSVENKDEDHCYNLIVADFNDYFVGPSKLLVHDVTFRNATEATVPGLKK